MTAASEITMRIDVTTRIEARVGDVAADAARVTLLQTWIEVRPGAPTHVLVFREWTPHSMPRESLSYAALLVAHGVAAKEDVIRMLWWCGISVPVIDIEHSEHHGFWSGSTWTRASCWVES